MKITAILYSLLLLVSMHSALSAQPISSDTVVLRDILTDAYFYDDSEETYLPLVEAESFSRKSIHFRIYKDQQSGTFLNMASDQEVAVFINHKIVGMLGGKQSILWSTDSLFQAHGDEIKITLYHQDLSLKALRVSLLGLEMVAEEQLSETEVIILKQRAAHNAFNNFIVIGLLVIGAFLAIIYNFYPRVTADFFRVSRALAFREMDENLLKSRPYTMINTLFYLFFSVAAAYLLICQLYLGGFKIMGGLSSLAGTIWLWIKASAVVFIWLILKFIIVKNFTSLFNIKVFLPSHYFNYVRIGLFIFMAMIIITVSSYLAFEIMSQGYYTTLFTILLIAVALRSLFLFFKLMNSAQYKFLHLFSYLCGTELIPLGIILFLGFNQPF